MAGTCGLMRFPKWSRSESPLTAPRWWVAECREATARGEESDEGYRMARGNVRHSGRPRERRALFREAVDLHHGRDGRGRAHVPLIPHVLVDLSGVPRECDQEVA